MRYQISVQKTQDSVLSKIDFDNIDFGRYYSDHMFIVDYINGEWTDPRIEPYGPMQFDPSNLALHYGQSVFEGMKATKLQDGTPVFWRPEQHSIRLNKSAARLAMPELPEDLFLQGLHTLVHLDKDFIPTKEGSALYIRPFMFALDAGVGVRPSSSYRFIIFTSPSGPYYSYPVKLLAETHYVRAAQGGVGEAKAAGNYAAAMLPTQLAKAKGFDQILWLDAKEFKYVQEVGTMNIFFVIDGKIVTPATKGTILKGITRDSILQIFKNNGYEVEERDLSIEEVVEAFDSGKLEDVFGSGTAAVISQVASITYKDHEMVLPSVENRKVSNWIKDRVNGIRSGRYSDKSGWLVPVKSSELVNS